ncbi:MAG TPA: YciI family protein [Kutzneria sp.]|nr:YciI family protein [Kutzneria sp.]
MKYLLMVCVDESLAATPEEIEAHIREVRSWAARMDERGVRVLGDRLRLAADATTLRTQDGELMVSDGPFAETKEQMAGFDVLDCADLAEAIEVASQHPGVRRGTIELRPFWE